jgi:hypothetical protein
MDPSAPLIERAHRNRVRKSDLSAELGIDRSTLWKYERQPTAAPEGFWSRYRQALDAIIRSRDNEPAGVA